ncbi:MAG: hypothetical protein LBC02_07380 [Planctomycetaceae bacterium]|jgi:signal transduction histidine kinase|nr:hypothetical protein [Planctomycetaceae bacterium]
MIQTIGTALFSTTAVVVVIMISSILMILLTWSFAGDRIHRKPIIVAWIIFLLFICLGLFYLSYSYRKVVETHVKIYQNISRHCARFLQRQTKPDQPEPVSRYYQYLHDCETRDNIIFSLYLVRKNGTRTSLTYKFLNLITPISNLTIPGNTIDENTIDENTINENTINENTINENTKKNVETWRVIPLDLLFGQEWLPNPIADAFENKIVTGIIKRTDYQENRMIYTIPLFEQNGMVTTVLCLEIREKDWQQELLFARILPHLFFTSFLVFFFIMQVILIRRRVIVKHLHDHRIFSFEQMLDHLIAVKMSAEEKSIDRNYLIRQVDSEFKKPLISVLELSFLLQQQLSEKPKTISDQEFWQEHLITFEKLLWGHNRLQRVLSDIRTFIDFEWNQLEVQPEEFSPQHIIRDLRNLCQQYLLEKPDIKFRIDTISAIPDLVRGDQQKIRRVLEELLEMAIDRATDGYIKITCYVSNSQLCWIILDTGVMPTDKEIRQLNDFYNSGLTCQTESYGKLVFEFNFGSNIASAFTHLLKGNITFQSTPGHGNKCTALFPIEV